MKLYTSDEYRQSNQDWHANDAPYKAKKIIELLARNNLPFATCADVGCGVGRIVNLLSERFPAARYEGFDISPFAIEKARADYGTETVKFTAGDFFASPTPYDLVLCIDVFEHVPNYLSFLNNMRVHGKYFVFHIPLEMNVVHLLADRALHKRKVGGHLHFFSPATALQVMQDAGFTVVDHSFTFGGIFQPHSFRSLTKLLLKLPRAVLAAVAPRWSAKLLGGASLLVLAKPAETSIFEN